MTAIHLCTVCLGDCNEHSERCDAAECPDGARHWPPLCCPGCDCRSYEEEHEVEA